MANTGKPWYDYRIKVPYGPGTGYDTLYGGAHDMDVATPPGTDIFALLPGKITAIDTNVPWGEQVTEYVGSWNGSKPYLSYLHLGAIAPGLKVGEQVQPGTILGLSGGANNQSQNNGLNLYLDTPDQSSGPQTGIAFSTGDYGVTSWSGSSFADQSDPTPLIKALQGGTDIQELSTGLNGGSGSTVAGIDVSGIQTWLGQSGIVVFGALIVLGALFLIFKD